jgi:hypothetical protein
MKKMVFWINKWNPERIKRIASLLFKRHPYIKAHVEGGRCVLHAHDVGEDPVSVVMEILLARKSFMGKYHCSLYDIADPNCPSRKIEYKQEIYQMPVCRFGWFDVCEDFSQFELSQTIFKNLRSGMPLHEAETDARAQHGASIGPMTDEVKRIQYDRYVRDLVARFDKTEDEAKAVIDALFPEWAMIPKKVVEPIVLTPEQLENAELQRKRLAAEEAERVIDLIGKLQFMSPNMRKRYLSSNFMDDLRIRNVVRLNGIEWVRRVIGEIPGLE